MEPGFFFLKHKRLIIVIMTILLLIITQSVPKIPGSVWIQKYYKSGNEQQNYSTLPDGINLLRIDPSLILHAMVKYGGLALPSYVEKDLKILGKVCHCQSTYLDVYNRELEIRNFSVDEVMKSENNSALSIGRVFLKWDSYLNPVVDIELEDVDIFVEFLNILLSQSNWNNLFEVGFPPKTYMEADVSSQKDTFIRIGSLSLLGNVKLRIWSKPLNQSICPDFIFEFAMLEELMDEISKKAKSSSTLSQQQQSKRIGCTTTELYEIVANYTNNKISQLIKSSFLDLAKFHLDPATTIKDSKTIHQVKNIYEKATENVQSYVMKSLQNKIGVQLQKWGMFDNANSVERFFQESDVEVLNEEYTVTSKLDDKVDEILATTFDTISSINIKSPWLQKIAKVAQDKFIDVVRNNANEDKLSQTQL